MADPVLPTDEEVAAQAAAMGLPVPPGQLPGLALGVRRNLGMALALRDLVNPDVTPDFVFRPVRRGGGAK